MRCPRCGTPRTDDELACPRCDTFSREVDPDAVEPLLARANLLRMRGQWSESAEQCIAVLRMAPSNATAHSLLGDIYQDQGQPAEARHWYQLALELHPKSEADRAKLARAEEALEARQQRGEWEAVLEGRSPPLPTSLLVRESLNRVAALAGGGLIMLILVMALSSASGGTADDELPTPPLPPPPRQKPTAITATIRERDLKHRVAESATGGAGQLVDVWEDPSMRMAYVRVLVPQRVRQPLSTPAFRTVVMREAYRFARAAYEAERTLPGEPEGVRVWVVTPAPSPTTPTSADLLLLATLKPADLAVAAADIRPEVLEQLFRSSQPPAQWANDLTPQSIP
jgi:hypothetical protein